MAAQTFNVKINGYWRDVNKSGIPNHSGVYFVYTSTFNPIKKEVSLNQLIYIGESDDVKNRVNNHDKYEEWKKYLKQGETLCFSTGPVDAVYRVRVEAAYINHHKPPVNTEYVNAFPFDKTTVISSGRIALLNSNFTVERS